MRWTIHYYSDRIRDEIFALPNGVLAGYLRLLHVLEAYGADLRMPHSRAMGDGLFELRPRGREGIGRVFYCSVRGRSIVMLHSIVKKSRETPPEALRIARARLKEVRNDEDQTRT